MQDSPSARGDLTPQSRTFPRAAEHGPATRRGSSERRRRLLLREVTRRETRPDRQTAVSAVSQRRPLLRDPPPAPA
ncbi:hypothetical protein D623_10015611 [Myotis brandtii]|uniref:Uncharacterized protein n=1 Tax=Myotis brandtii TaxID=109478 RepID=S7PJ64_MYOBR|nr:hypothetical protein D623_10015611 [Myotis brandtii]